MKIQPKSNRSRKRVKQFMRQANTATVRTLRRRLLHWFDRNRRDLPWRRTKDPYRIWLSEIMLQQTRVPVVIPYYERFLRAFPSVGKLTRARDVLRHWSGLGYYSRARNLQRAAKEIVHKHDGRFPDKLEEALALPGVGPYTARAILSIAYGKRLAVVDGNVARVLIRLFQLSRASVDQRVALQPLADQLVSPHRPGDFNQALMELGSAICLPKAPRCPLCPCQELCAARRAGIETSIPARGNRPARPRLVLNVFVATRKQQVLVVREPQGYFSGLWHFPYRVAEQHGTRDGAGDGSFYVGTIHHTTTMRDLVLRVHRVKRGKKVTATGGKQNSRACWIPLGSVTRLGVGAATRKIVEILQQREGSRAFGISKKKARGRMPRFRLVSS